VEKRWTMRGMLSTGWCGGLDPTLQVGDIVVADRVISEDPPATYPAQPPHAPSRDRKGAVLTVNRFITTAEEKHLLRATGAIAVDMEAAAVGAEAARLAVPFFCIRTV